MSTRSLGLAFAAGSCLVALGCGPTDALESSRLGVSEEPIKGGYTDTKDVAVVGIFDMQAGGMCSGSLIAPNLVLTARHCVAPVINEVSGGVSCQVTKFGANHPASVFYVTTKGQFSQNPKDYHLVAKVESVPVGATAPFCANDTAILILKQNVDSAEAMPLVPRVDSELEKGEEYYAVGYGATDGQGSGAGLRRRRDGLFVDCVGTKCPAEYSVALKKTEFLGDTGICQGDSGGPAFDMQARVVGITSRGGAECTMPIYTQVFGWGEWIKQVGLEAAKAGGYDPPAWATGWPSDPAYGGTVGTACTTDKACPAAHCILGGEAGGYCSRLCNDATPCPDTYQCDADKKLCLAIPPPPEDAGAGGGGGAPAGGEPKKATPAATDAGSSGGCAVGPLGSDPTKPDPWFAGALAALAFVVRRRRA